MTDVIWSAADGTPLFRIPDGMAVRRMGPMLDGWVTASCTKCGWDVDSRNDRDWMRYTAIHACGAPSPPATRDYLMCTADTITPERDRICCVLAERHAGAHQAGNGTIWYDVTPTPLCGATSRSVPSGGTDWVCVLDAGHAGHHTMRDGHHWHRHPKDTP